MRTWPIFVSTVSLSSPTPLSRFSPCFVLVCTVVCLSVAFVRACVHVASVCTCVRLSVCLPACLLARLSVCLPACLSSLRVCVCVFACRCVRRLSFCLPVFVSVCWVGCVVGPSGCVLRLCFCLGDSYQYLTLCLNIGQEIVARHSQSHAVIQRLLGGGIEPSEFFGPGPLVSWVDPKAADPRPSWSEPECPLHTGVASSVLGCQHDVVPGRRPS